ncbi:MAG: hypothetical protein KDD47_09015 [Acidobacteria bacterium]|nr:hypothetical protein [Acidobacteriota bacterium]
MDYPLTMSFKILALAPQVYLRDSSGTPLLYVRQKLLKLKEKIQVFRDDSKTTQLFEINADRVIDFSARYHFSDPNGNSVGSIKRRGARSLWRASYEISDEAGNLLFTLEEENPWVKLLDGLLGEIPLLGAFTGYFLNPTYRMSRAGSEGTALRVVKHRSFLESRFEISCQDSTISGRQEIAALLGLLMVVLLERSRG